MRVKVKKGGREGSRHRKRRRRRRRRECGRGRRREGRREETLAISGQFDIKAGPQAL